ncbi:helix-turn-helix domain-containing protein [Eubacteriales bacterium OttesenSCG-928-A19]|nr:helix-turn-helix domain-containing protein [Eubacteriales bacterium OttesenSCG-928-A19]
MREELAGKLHVVRQTISKWEKGISVPDAGLLVRFYQTCLKRQSERFLAAQ